MNIFFLDRDPIVCASYHCDKHVVKMILETAQILSTVCRKHGLDAPYRMTHANHPCVVWAGASTQNYAWLVMLGLALCDEYTRRYGRVHASRAVIEACNALEPRLPDIGMTEPPQAMPDACRRSDPVSGYREYYRTEKRAMARWSCGDAPAWFNAGEGVVHV